MLAALEHMPSVNITVYVVEVVGLAITEALLFVFKPADGNQLYAAIEFPGLADSATDEPWQKLVAPAIATGDTVFAVTATVPSEEQAPLFNVMV